MPALFTVGASVLDGAQPAVFTLRAPATPDLMDGVVRRGGVADL
jgi:hypothetical protein